MSTRNCLVVKSILHKIIFGTTFKEVKKKETKNDLKNKIHENNETF